MTIKASEYKPRKFIKRGSMEIDLETYKKLTHMDFMPGDEKMDSIVILKYKELFYEPKG